MLLSLFLGASAGASYVISTYPCQRLGWAWRNVWVTCSIDARVPGDYIMPTGITPHYVNAPNFNEGFRSYGSSPYNAPTLDLNLLAADAPSQYAVTPFTLVTNSQKALQFCKAVGGAPSIADTNLHMLGVRTACRRAIDLYGSLLELCRNPVRARIPLMPPGNAATPTNGQLIIGTKNKWTFAGVPSLTVGVPNEGWLTPHFANGQTLQYMQHECIAPGQLGFVANNNCPGIIGWWTVVYQACNIANTNPFRTAGVNSEGHYSPRAQAIVMDATKHGVSTTWDSLAVPGAFCRNAATTPDAFNPTGPTFRGSACRRALDQFARTAHRCQPNDGTLIPTQKALKNLGVFLGTWAPRCDA